MMKEYKPCPNHPDAEIMTMCEHIAMTPGGDYAAMFPGLGILCPDCCGKFIAGTLTNDAFLTLCDDCYRATIEPYLGKNVSSQFN